MKAHVFCTPEFSNETIKGVVDLLKSVPGRIQFYEGESMTPGLFSMLNSKFENPDAIDSLTFEEFFHLTKGYRNSERIKKEDFVILISSIPNNFNWFSAFKNRDVFIHGGEWDQISNVDSKFELAYQCVENIFQSLIDLEEYHQTSIGCINDFCQNKSEILLKLQTGNICKECLDRAIKKDVDGPIIAHIIEIIKKVREAFVVSVRFFEEVNLEPVYVDERGNISIGGIKIEMETLPKTMYITFLANIEGIRSDEKCKKSHLFDEVYNFIKAHPDKYAIQKMCCNKIKYRNGDTENNKPTFETYRTKAKTAIKEAVGESLTSYYCINLIGNSDNIRMLKVNLTNEKVNISPEFLNKNRNISK